QGQAPRRSGLKRIGLLGCGAIGKEIALAIDYGKIPAQLTHIYDFSKTASTTLANKLQNKPQITDNVSLLAAAPVDLIVEAASQIDLDTIEKATTIYEGSAQEAVTLFPANINVAAILSLAGIGGKKTSVKIIADPSTDKNIHEIQAEGKFGRFSIKVANVSSPSNPKTSRLAILSAI